MDVWGSLKDHGGAIWGVVKDYVPLWVLNETCHEYVATHNFPYGIYIQKLASGWYLKGT